MDFWYTVAKTTVGAYLKLFIKSIEVQGLENIPHGPKIIVANHATVNDGFILPFIFKEKLHFFIQAEIFQIPVIGRLLKLADQIPVAVNQGRSVLNEARDRILNGQTVVIFPEGRLNNGGEMHRAGSGAAILALQTGAPVLPVGFYCPPEKIRMLSARMHWNNVNGGWQFGGRAYISIGQSLRLLANSTGDHEYRQLRDLTDQIMGNVNLLVQQARDKAQGYLASYNSLVEDVKKHNWP